MRVDLTPNPDTLLHAEHPTLDGEVVDEQQGEPAAIENTSTSE